MTLQSSLKRPFPPIGLGINLVGKEEAALVTEVLESRSLFRYDYKLPLEEQGAMTSALEREVCELMGVKYALSVTSGTAALEICLAAMGVGPGDEVIIPAWSWISCFTAVVRLGALPVMAEIDETFCIAPGEITRLRTPHTKVVLIMHYQGVAAEMDTLMREAEEAGIAVLEDCAQSPGVIYKGRRIGSIGTMGIYSFQFNKTVSSGEGGMVVTSDLRLYERAIRMHDLGMVRPFHRQFITPSEKHFAGGQYRMNEVTAAVALAQFRRLDNIRAHCRGLRDRVMREIAHLPGLRFRTIPDATGDSGFEIYFCVETPELAQRFTRLLLERGVNCGRTTATYCHYEREYCQGAYCYHEAVSPFRHFPQWPAPGYRAVDFPRTEELIHRFVSMQLGTLYTEEDADHIAQSLREVHAECMGNE